MCEDIVEIDILQVYSESLSLIPKSIMRLSLASISVQDNHYNI